MEYAARPKRDGQPIDAVFYLLERYKNLEVGPISRLLLWLVLREWELKLTVQNSLSHIGANIWRNTPVARAVTCNSDLG